MAVKTLPNETKIGSIDWRLVQPAQVNRSGYTGARQVMGLPGGARWTGSIEFVAFANDAEARLWRGFLSSLEGQVHTFYLYVLNAQHAGANPTATGVAGATTATLSAAIGLLSGQFMTFTLSSGKRQMVVLTQDMAGAVATFRPQLREATGAAATVETIAPYAEVALASDSVAWLSAPGKMFDFPSIDFEEAY